MPEPMKWALVGLLLIATPLAVLAHDDYSRDRDVPRHNQTVQKPDPQLIYDALDVGEWRVLFVNPDSGLPRIGVTVFERSVGGLLCRRTAPVVPDPTFRYQCYVQLPLTDRKAMVLFNFIDSAVEQVNYIDPETEAPRVGTTVLEKSNETLLCQSVSPVVPDPIPRYTCYRNIEAKPDWDKKSKKKKSKHNNQRDNDRDKKAHWD